jgi:hypothetical protein
MIVACDEALTIHSYVRGPIPLTPFQSQYADGIILDVSTRISLSS